MTFTRLDFIENKEINIRAAQKADSIIAKYWMRQVFGDEP